MPDPKKKVLVKVAKKAESSEAEGSVLKGLSKDAVSKINETTEINKKRLDVENVAKNDSISGAAKAKLAGSNIYMQRKHGNDAANKTRVSSGAGNPVVQRFTNPHQYSGVEAHTGAKDTYIRDGNLEKDMPKIKKVLVKVKKK